jgi:hypothetical protein
MYYEMMKGLGRFPQDPQTFFRHRAGLSHRRYDSHHVGTMLLSSLDERPIDTDNWSAHAVTLDDDEPKMVWNLLVASSACMAGSMNDDHAVRATFRAV